MLHHPRCRTVATTVTVSSPAAPAAPPAAGVSVFLARSAAAPRHFGFSFLCLILPATLSSQPCSLSSRTDSSVSAAPKRTYEKERLDLELKLCGEYGLRAKKEIWRVNRQLAHCRKAARVLLTLEEKDPRRLFEGAALLKRLTSFGVLGDDKQKLDHVLELETQDFLERRLQTQIWKLDMAKSIHHARVLIKQRHIRCALAAPLVPFGAARRQWRSGRERWLFRRRCSLGEHQIRGPGIAGGGRAWSWPS